MTIELQQISPWFQTAFEVRMRSEMGRSMEETVSMSMSRKRGRKKRGRLIYSSTKGKRAGKG